MGAYLSTPLTEKESTDEANEYLACGASQMQGWRMSQEVNSQIHFHDTSKWRQERQSPRIAFFLNCACGSNNGSREKGRKESVHLCVLQKRKRAILSTRFLRTAVIVNVFGMETIALERTNDRQMRELFSRRPSERHELR